jgi:hypothetical protein
VSRRSARALHICSWSSGLDQMKRKDQGYAAKVLQQLHRSPRFSVFEATQNAKIAKMMDYLVAEKFIEVDNSPGYPWSTAKLTARGRSLAGVE